MQAAVTYGQEELKEKVLIYIEQHTEVTSRAVNVVDVKMI